jgi:hypothetical protein
MDYKTDVTEGRTLVQESEVEKCLAYQFQGG